MSVESGPSQGGSTSARSRRRRGSKERPTIEQILGGMDREAAGPGFTARVLARAASVRQRRSRGRLAALALPFRAVPLRAVPLRAMPLVATAALAAAAVAGFVLAPRFSGDSRPSFAPPAVVSAAEVTDPEAEALRVRLQALERELQELQRLAAERQPLIAVEGDHADYVIDLRDFLPTTRGPSATPASWENGSGRRPMDRAMNRPRNR